MRLVWNRILVFVCSSHCCVYFQILYNTTDFYERKLNMKLEMNCMQKDNWAHLLKCWHAINSSYKVLQYVCIYVCIYLCMYVCMYVCRMPKQSFIAVACNSALYAIILWRAISVKSNIGFCVFLTLLYLLPNTI